MSYAASSGRESTAAHACAPRCSTRVSPLLASGRHVEDIRRVIVRSLASRVRAVALIGAIALGCGSDMVHQVEGWADRACACKDAECAGKVRTEFTAWVE